MGRIIAQTILSCECFHDCFEGVITELNGTVNLVMPIEPDTNLVAIMFNPEGNKDVAVMNRFGNSVYEHFKVDKTRPVQINQFMGTHTLIYKENLQQSYIEKLLGKLKLDPEIFKIDSSDGAADSDHLFVLRHTTMNPWLRIEAEGNNYIDRYFEYLKSVLLKELDKLDSI